MVDKAGGGKVTQPLYTAPCADLRAKRIVHDGTSVRWTIPTLAGGIVRIPSTPLLDPHVAPNSMAWRMGGTDETYLAPPRRESNRNRADQRKNAEKARYTADSNMMDAVAPPSTRRGVPAASTQGVVRGIRAPVLRKAFRFVKWASHTTKTIP